MKRLFFKGRFIFIPIAVAAFLTLTGFVVMQLWNNLLPGILHVGMITFWQAIGIFILCKILFGFHRGGRGWGGRGAPWMRHRMEERFKNMTPEEKEKFKQKMRERGGCGPWGHDGGHRFGRDWDDVAEEPKKPTE
jgi:hypothetical protein